MDARRYWGLAALVCVAVGVAAGELVASLASPATSPVSSVGQLVIDVLPGPVKEWAIALFGTEDKTVFIIFMLLVMALLAAGAGLLERRLRGSGLVILAVFGLVGILAVATRANVSQFALLAPVAAGGVSLWLLFKVRSRFLSPSLGRELHAEYRAEQRNVDHAPSGSGRSSTGVPSTGVTTTSEPPVSAATTAKQASRRVFFAYMGAGLVVAAVAGGASVVFRRSALLVADLRAKVNLPQPLQKAPPIPAAAQLDIAGITPLVTAQDDFYRIDTALVVPSVNSETWQLKVTGMVEREITLDFAQLLAKPMMESYVTIGCVSNDVGGDLVGNARWLGWPVRELLAEAGVLPGADMVLSTSTDGFTAGTPLEAMTDTRNALIAVGMNGSPLPLVHGYPARLIVPGLYGYVSATKWLTELKVTTFAADQGYWTPRGWSALGPIKLASRIDVPASNAKTNVGTFTLAGVAWSPQHGISAVQVQLDGGSWQAATLAVALNKNTWVQWKAELQLTSGKHQLKVRAVDGSQLAQTQDVAPPAPNGASGYHTVEFTTG